MAQMNHAAIDTIIAMVYNPSPSVQAAALEDLSRAIKEDPSCLVYLRERAPRLYDLLIQAGLQVQAEATAVRAATSGEA